MSENEEYELSHNLVQFYDAALDDTDSAFKDSVEFKSLSEIDDRYSAREFAGEGGMKQIFSCLDHFTSRKIAMAVPREDSTPEQIDLFIREARITAGLQHPHIVPVYELAVDCSRPYFTMKFLEGEDLGRALKSKEFSLNQLLDIFLKICDAVAYAHAKGVLHLDLKPENIHFDEFGDVLVCDWGLARKLADKSESAVTAGTPGFMAPEQREGKVYGCATDIYSLGSLLHYLLTKELYEENAANVNIPKSLKAVIAKALSAEPIKRYKAVSELSAEIRAYINGFATAAEDAGYLKLFILLIKRSKILTATIVSFIVIIIAMALFFIINLNKEKIAAQNAQKESIEIRQETTPEMVRLAKREYKLRNFDGAHKTIDMALKLDPDNENAHFFKARCLTGEHKFDQALAEMEMVDEAHNDFVEYIRKFKDISAKKNLLEYEELPKLIDDFRTLSRVPNLKKHFLLNCTKIYDEGIRLEFARRYLQYMTKNDLKWIYNEADRSLDISNNPGLYDITVLHNLRIHRLNLNGSPVKEVELLRKLPLTHLDISNTSIADIVPVFNCPLMYLNIDGTNVANIYGLRSSPLEELVLNDKAYKAANILEFQNLKKLTVYRKSFSEKELLELKKKFVVTVKE